jgi:uncharacterized membrane protein
MRKFIRKIVSTVLIAAMLFFVPSVIPSIKPASATISGCGVNLLWLPIDTAFAQSKIPNPPPPCPTAHAHVPAWPWLVIGCAASIVVSAVAANFWQNRQLTTPEAWTCGALYWWYPTAFPPQPTNKRR